MSNRTKDYDKSFILTDNINLSGYEFQNAVIAPDRNFLQEFDGVEFTGIFDGSGFTITNVKIIAGYNAKNFLGLFGYAKDSLINNLAVKNITIFSDQSYFSGGLCGWNEGVITNCFTTGSISGRHFNVGGLVGVNESYMANCYSDCYVSGRQSSGGVAGYNYGNIKNSYCNSDVECEWMYNGGISGSNKGILENCYFAGNVWGGSNRGAITGYNLSGSYINSYFLDTAGPDNGFGEPLTDAQMRDINSFIDWDFSYSDGDEADWFMAYGGYPILPWQISPVDIYTDGKNNLVDFAVFASYWLRDDCGVYNYYCEFSDVDFDGNVDINDLYELMDYWLEMGIY